MKAALKFALVIAERELTDVQTDQRVLVSVGTPQYIGDGWDWPCPHIITGFGEPIHGHAHGIDALQSLQLVSNWQSAFPR